MSQPIEHLLRDEAPPEAPVLVVRGGPLTAQKIVEHAARLQAVFTYRGEPMIAISVDLAIEGWPLERILRERMWSRSRYATTTVGQLRSNGYELVAAGFAPHYSVVLPEATAEAAASLLDNFGPTLVNEFKQRRKRPCPPTASRSTSRAIPSSSASPTCPSRCSAKLVIRTGSPSARS